VCRAWHALADYPLPQRAILSSASDSERRSDSAIRWHEQRDRPDGSAAACPRALGVDKIPPPALIHRRVRALRSARVQGGRAGRALARHYYKFMCARRMARSSPTTGQPLLRLIPVGTYVQLSDGSCRGAAVQRERAAVRRGRVLRPNAELRQVARPSSLSQRHGLFIVCARGPAGCRRGCFDTWCATWASDTHCASARGRVCRRWDETAG